MTKIPLKSKKWLKYIQNLKNEQNTHKKLKMTKIPSKTYKFTEIPLEPKKWPKYTWNIYNYQNRGLGYFGCFKGIFNKLKVLRVFQ